LRYYPEDANTVWGGNSACKHEFEIEERKHKLFRERLEETSPLQAKNRGSLLATKSMVKSGFCKKCGAWFGQLGNEPTLELFIEHLLMVTKELKRVLKPTGTFWLNIGDSYIGSMQGFGQKKPSTGIQNVMEMTQYPGHYGAPPQAKYKKIPKKCMSLQNFRLVLRMIDEQGFILRNTIIWKKLGHLPSSVHDRLTNAYEPVFFFVKSNKTRLWYDKFKKEWYDKKPEQYWVNLVTGETTNEKPEGEDRIFWTKAILGYHYFFNLDEIRLPIKGESFLRYISQAKLPISKRDANDPKVHFHKLTKLFKMQKKGIDLETLKRAGIDSPPTHRMHPHFANLFGKNPGDVWELPTAKGESTLHFAQFPEELVEKCIIAGSPKGGVVLDPFAGSGTTLKVARELGRSCIGIEIVGEYISEIKRRVGWGMSLPKSVTWTFIDLMSEKNEKKV